MLVLIKTMPPRMLCEFSLLTARDSHTLTACSLIDWPAAFQHMCQTLGKVPKDVVGSTYTLRSVQEGAIVLNV